MIAIEEIKRAVERVEQEKILNSVFDLTVRLRLIKKKWRRLHSLNKVHHFMQNLRHYILIKKCLLIEEIIAEKNKHTNSAILYGIFITQVEKLNGKILQGSYF